MLTRARLPVFLACLFACCPALAAGEARIESTDTGISAAGLSWRAWDVVDGHIRAIPAGDAVAHDGEFVLQPPAGAARRVVETADVVPDAPVHVSVAMACDGAARKGTPLVATLPFAKYTTTPRSRPGRWRGWTLTAARCGHA